MIDNRTDEDYHCFKSCRTVLRFIYEIAAYNDFYSYRLAQRTIRSSYFIVTFHALNHLCFLANNFTTLKKDHPTNCNVQNEDGNTPLHILASGEFKKESRQGAIAMARKLIAIWC